MEKILEDKLCDILLDSPYAEDAKTSGLIEMACLMAREVVKISSAFAEWMEDNDVRWMYDPNGTKVFALDHISMDSQELFNRFISQYYA